MKRNPSQPGVNSPPWVMIVGAVFGGLTLVFFMALVVVSMTGALEELGRGTRQLVVVVMAFATSLSFSFIGGSAAAKGQVPWPFVKNNPMAFSLGGGIAVFVIVLFIGFTLFVGRAGDSDTSRPSARASRGWALADIPRQVIARVCPLARGQPRDPFEAKG